MPFRVLHTMIRVHDLDASLNFYTKLLGMTLFRRKDYPQGKHTIAFVGYGDEASSAIIGLTHNWGRKEPYSVGDGFGHLGIAVPDPYTACENLSVAGVRVTRPAGPMKYGTTVIAFVEDTDGYKIELIQR